MSAADPPRPARCGLLADEASQLLYLKDALLSGDRLALRRAIIVVAGGPAVARLVAAIDDIVRHDS